jgi:hypothetical protein
MNKGIKAPEEKKLNFETKDQLAEALNTPVSGPVIAILWDLLKNGVVTDEEILGYINK